MRKVFVAQVVGSFAGYVNVVRTSEYSPFREITDLNVLVNYRRKGVATALLGKSELLIAGRSKTAGIRAGVDRDCAPAQQLYVLRGYVPDDHGLSCGHRLVRWGDTIKVDDDLTLAFTKHLD